MNETEKRQFWVLLQGVYEFYRCRSDLSDFAASVWWNACRSYSMEQVSKAFSAHLVDPKAGQFLPKPADIVRALSGTHEDRSLLAWGKTFEAMQRVGQYSSVVFDDPVIHAVISDLGGWPKLCQVTEHELPFMQRRFCDAHAAYSRAGRTEYPRMLPGVHDIQNNALGHMRTPSKPVLIGDAEAAKQVLANGSTTGKTTFTTLTDAAMRALLPAPEKAA
jgi:hypothetical protein